MPEYSFSVEFLDVSKLSKYYSYHFLTASIFVIKQQKKKKKNIFVGECVFFHLIHTEKQDGSRFGSGGVYWGGLGLGKAGPFPASWGQASCCLRAPKRILSLHYMPQSITLHEQNRLQFKLNTLS